jgi:hypothetical protein
MGVELGLTLREERRLRIFENRMVRMIFGPKKYEMTGGGGGGEELCDLCS